MSSLQPWTLWLRYEHDHVKRALRHPYIYIYRHIYIYMCMHTYTYIYVYMALCHLRVAKGFSGFAIEPNL